MRNVQVIPATKTEFSKEFAATSERQRRVAAYARVSTAKDEQLGSYEAQISYYSEYIASKQNWQLVDIYTDSGISAVTTKYREGFKKMVSDALSGKIDLIVTKSVSRFARNTVDSLQTIRKLKENGVECFFEKENIWTFDSKGELLITIMASLAQEESRNISENVTWGKRKRMADGKVSLPWSSFLGYEKGEDDLPKGVPHEAETVRLIYKMFLEGKSYSTIAKHLTETGVATPMGRVKWGYSTIKNILQNETYKGSKCLQKTLTVDFLTKTQKPNEGELPMFYIENSHEAIISPDEWAAVQAEIARRQALGRPISCHSPFASRIICGECGDFFGSKVWNSATRYKQHIWRCNSRYNSKSRDCKTPHVTETALIMAFQQAWEKLTTDREKLLADCRQQRDILHDNAALDAELEQLRQELETIGSLSGQLVAGLSAISQSEWERQNEDLLSRYGKAIAIIKELETLKRERLAKCQALEVFADCLAKYKGKQTDFNETLWLAVVENVVVGADGGLTFKFKNGTDVHI